MYREYWRGYSWALRLLATGVARKSRLNAARFSDFI